MSGYFDYKYISYNEVDSLEKSFDNDDVKRQLAEIFKISYNDPRLQEVAVDFHHYNYAFSKEKAFDSKRISTLLSIMAHIFEHDMQIVTVDSPIFASVEFLKQLLTKHSVQRSPQSVQIFSLSDVEAILSHASEHYYANFELYRFMFGKYRRILINQVAPGGVEYPSIHKVLPLNQAVENKGL